MAEHTAPSPTVIDARWLREHPLPQPENNTDKNARGRVLVVGGSITVPGGIRLTAEGALRAGAGKVRIATVEGAALPLGVLIPEAAVVALPMDEAGEVQGTDPSLEAQLGRCDTLIVGPAMSGADQACRLVEGLLSVSDFKGGVVIDAAALLRLGEHAHKLRTRDVPAVLTPHIGEMAGMLGLTAEEIEDDRARAALAAARQFGSVVVLKGASTWIAHPDGRLLFYGGGGVGLATGGSGDVLAGVVGGILARGCDPLCAAAWSVWLHGEAGRRCAETVGPLGFLARELLPFLPGLMASGAL
ncbi:NAD(P)H-hydrate dehydratase [Novosphingobium panipatense]|uniref:NAD(P)H-hydrate dehydratase n=1 Tax=Novosphingobium TaxID=165696 RepID=UPI000CDB2A78|nr:NAD(P)H-hydrate dehydratase [Novosphingobium sp. HII-3]